MEKQSSMDQPEPVGMFASNPEKTLDMETTAKPENDDQSYASPARLSVIVATISIATFLCGLVSSVHLVSGPKN